MQIYSVPEDRIQIQLLAFLLKKWIKIKSTFFYFFTGLELVVRIFFNSLNEMRVMTIIPMSAIYTRIARTVLKKT